MKILLKKDRRTIEFVDGIDKLNANDVMVNTLEVGFESPLLHGETLWVTFEKEDQHLETTKPILATNEYKVTIPASVIKVPGEWSLQLFIKRYDAVSKNLVSRQASIKVTFTVENGLYVDDEMDLANNGSLASLYLIADKNTRELPLTLQHLMDFTNQPFYASDGSLAVEKEGITYSDLMAKLKGDADTLTLADVVTTWKREAFNRDARVGDEFFGTARTKDDYIVGLNCKVIKVDESEERKGRPYWGVTDVEIIRYPDKEIALVSNITLEFSKTYAEIVALTNAGADVDSFPVDGLNRRPNIGERFFAVCTSGDKYGFGMTAEVVGFATAAEGREYAVFKCIEVVLLAGSTIPKQVKELQRRMSKIDGGEGESGESTEPIVVPLVLNKIVDLGDTKVSIGSLKGIDLSMFNRKPNVNDKFVTLGYDADGNVYAIQTSVVSVGESSATCRFGLNKILHDEERLALIDSKVNKSGDTMTGPLTVTNGSESVSYLANGLHQATGHSERSIYLPPIRENTPTEENPSAGYLDETLVARSEIDPLKAKLDTVEEIAKGAQIAESFTSYEEMVNTLVGEFLGGSDGLTTELKYKKGQSIYIETVDVPDLWVSRVEEDNFNPYLYTTDEAIVSALATNGYIQVGHYRLAQLENGKVDITNLVKKTDYATASEAGLVRPSASNGINIGGGGVIYIVSANNTEIDAKKTNYKPIVPSNIDKAWKVSATTNTETWTDEDKAKACETIGAARKLGAGDGRRVYGVFADGSETSFTVVNAVKEATIPWRGVGGTVIVGTPTAYNHATTKEWVEGLIAELASVEGHVTIVQGTKLYKHTFAELNGEDDNYDDFLFLSARSTPYTNMNEVTADFRLPTTCITCYHEALGYMRCYEVHKYGGFYFEGKTFSMGAAFNVTDTVTEYKG